MYSPSIFRHLFSLLSLFSLGLLLSGCSTHRSKLAPLGPIEIVAELDVTPGNMTISQSGRMFASVHGLRRGRASGATAQLIEITGPANWKPFPNKAWNRAPGSLKGSAGRNILNSPLGVIVDNRDWLWVIDSGNFLEKPIAAKLVAFDIKSGLVKFRYDFPERLAPRGSLLQDLAITPDGKFVFIADAGGTSRPGIVVVNIAQKSAYRYDSMKKFEAEDIDIVVRGQVLTLKDKNGKIAPVRLGINPITISADGKTVYFGAMNGTSWYSVPAELLRKKAARTAVNNAIVREGAKPISDGATTDLDGNHYFTSVTTDSIMRLGKKDGEKEGELVTVLQDELLEWPDSIRFGADGYLYVAINQLNRTAALSASLLGGSLLAEGKDTGAAPYKIIRFQVADRGQVGR